MFRLYIALLLALFSCQAWTLIISPTVLEVSTEPGASAQIRLENTSALPTPIEVSVRQLMFKADGSFSTLDIEHPDLVVFPPASMLAPGGVQMFRLQWLGESLPHSESFFIRFTQPAIETIDDNVGSALAVEIHYNALVHLSDPAHKPLLTLNIATNGKATLSNQGSRYAFLRQFRFHLPNAAALNEPETLLGERFIPPFSSIVLESPSLLQAGNYVGELR